MIHCDATIHANVNFFSYTLFFLFISLLQAELQFKDWLGDISVLGFFFFSTALVDLFVESKVFKAYIILMRIPCCSALAASVSTAL